MLKISRLFLNLSQIRSRSRYFHPNKKGEKPWKIWNTWTLSRRTCSFQTSKIHCFCRFVSDFFYGKNKKSSACEASTGDIPWIETRNKLNLKFRSDFFVSFNFCKSSLIQWNTYAADNEVLTENNYQLQKIVALSIWDIKTNGKLPVRGKFSWSFDQILRLFLLKTLRPKVH